jgi:hypothetical protein
MSTKHIRCNIVNYVATILSFVAIAIRSFNECQYYSNNKKFIAETYFLQRNELTVTTKYICGNTTNISQPFINLVAITHTYYNKKIHVAMGSVAIDRFFSSVI